MAIKDREPLAQYFDRMIQLLKNKKLCIQSIDDESTHTVEQGVRLRQIKFNLIDNFIEDTDDKQ